MANKLAITNEVIVADLAALRAIASSGLAAQDVRYVAAEDRAYVYWPTAKDGDEKPDDVLAADPGRWYKENDAGLAGLIFLVPLNHDFPTNNDTDVTSLAKWDVLIKAGQADFSQKKDWVKDQYDTLGFGSLSSALQTAAAELMIATRAERDTVLTAAVQVAKARELEVHEGRDRVMRMVRLGGELRARLAKSDREIVENELVSFGVAPKFVMFGRLGSSEGDADGILDYIEATSGFTVTGLAASVSIAPVFGTLADLVAELAAIIRDGKR